MTKIICIGSACKDIFFPTAEGRIMETPNDILSQKKIAFELGAKYKIEERHEALGGCAANVAVGLARLGVSAGCYSHIGNDQIADRIISELEKNNVEVALVTKDDELPSDMSAIVVDENSGERVIFSNQKVNAKLEIIPDKISSAEWLFVGDLHGDWQKDLDAIITVAKENKIKLAYNPKQSQIHEDVKKIVEIISGTNVLFLNKDEALEILSQVGKFSIAELDDEKFLAQELKKLGAEIVVITDGVRGAWVSDGGEVFFVPGRKVNAVDSTGAGDAFASGFLGAYFKEKTLKECLDWGIINSSSSVQFYGAIAGLLDEEEIMKIV